MGLTPDKVVVAAAELAGRVGIGRLSLSALATELGVRVPSLYKHVRGLDDLQERLAAQGADGLAEAVEVAAKGAAGRDALTAIGVAYRRFARTNRGYYQAMVRLGAEDGDHPHQFTRVEAVLRRVVGGYGLGPSEAREAARTLLSALHGFVLLEADGALGADPDASLRTMIGLLDRAVAAAVQPKPRFRLANRGTSAR